MQWIPKQIVVTVLAAFWVATAQAQEPAARLRWKNGDMLPGKLMESDPGTVCWASEYFSDNLVTNISAIDSILFPKQLAPPMEAFQIGTVSDDVWTADLIGADDNTFLFFSKRHGQVRVNRDAIYTLNRRESPNLIFDGSQLTAWESFKAVESKVPFLLDVDARSSWLPNDAGHLQTKRAKASIFCAFNLPKRFEIDLEFTSTEPPGFVLAIGESMRKALRLETWADEVVVIQDVRFMRVLTFGRHQRSIRLRLMFDDADHTLNVFDVTGRLLVNVQNLEPITAKSGLFIRNRGRNLTIRRLSVYRQPTEGAKQPTDPSKPRVHMIDGQVIYGRLFVSEGAAYVLDAQGNRRNIDLARVDRIIQPKVELTSTGGPAELIYADGTVLRGRVEQLKTDRAILRTTFADEPVICMLAGASQLQLGQTAETSYSSKDDDRLFHASGSLRGSVLFDGKDASPILWQFMGATAPVRLAPTGEYGIERSSKRVSRESLFDKERFPNMLHLKNGEVIPCEALSYDEKMLSFQSPFITERKIDSPFVKGIEFKPSKRPGPNKESSTELDWRHETRGVEQKPSLGIDSVKLEHALTVPRFNRDNPPSHLLVANTGDFKRGKLLGFNGQTIQFDSKLRKLTIPINRVARIIDVSRSRSNRDPRYAGSEEQPDKSAVVVNNASNLVQITLADRSILTFEPLRSQDGMLFGHSPIYGGVAVPVSSIHYLHFGGYEGESIEPVFEEWVVRPSKEPEFGGNR